MGDFLKGLNALIHIKTSYFFPKGHLFGVFLEIKVAAVI